MSGNGGDSRVTVGPLEPRCRNLHRPRGGAKDLLFELPPLPSSTISGDSAASGLVLSVVLNAKKGDVALGIMGESPTRILYAQNGLEPQALYRKLLSRVEPQV
jgi:hypothetical protein